MKSAASKTIKANISNVLRMQAGLQVQARQSLENQQKILKGFEKLYEEEQHKAKPNQEKLDQLSVHIGMQEEIVAQYQDTLIQLNAPRQEL